MAPKSPWGKAKATTTAHAKKNDVDAAALPAINYGEIQADEIEALRAIYMDDYEEVEIKGAWSKTTDLSFKLKLRAFTDPESYVLLSVHLTATYPKTAPILNILSLDAYHERTQTKIQNILRCRSKELLGDAMIHVIASEIQEAIEDAVLARQQGTLPSLEEERVSAEEVAHELARQAEEAQQREQQAAKEEEDRMLSQMVSEELIRREKRKSTKLLPQPEYSDIDSAEKVSFEQPAAFKLDLSTAYFTEVTIEDVLWQTKSDRLCRATAYLNSGAALRTVLVRQPTLEKTRAEVLELEETLGHVKALRHPAILALLAYRIDILGSVARITTCMENATNGTLRRAIQRGVNVRTARQYIINLLEGLEYIHRNDMVHGCLSIDTVFLTGWSTEVPKLAEMAYGTFLNTARPSAWLAPEGNLTSNKVDIWALGTVIAQLLLGLQITEKYPTPTAMLQRTPFSDPCATFLRRLFTSDYKRRPTAFDLLTAEFLRTDAPVVEESLPSPTMRKGSLPFRSRHNSSNGFETTSRYANDFTEIRRIGRGGFGEVVMARNKLDGGVYAIKKIRQLPQLDKVLSEVMLLNRLNHPYVVRYYSTWVETDLNDTIGEEMSSNTATETQTKTTQDGEDSERDDLSSESSSAPGFGYQSAGAYDFVSSSHPRLQFGGSDSGDELAVQEDGESDSIFERNEDPVMTSNSMGPFGSNLRKHRSDSRRLPSTLYIQMELCDQQTLRDLIRKRITSDDSWRLVRQITEGLANIHSHGIIHRDMKPDNVFIDLAGNPKIGDFGLATTSRHQGVNTGSTEQASGDMTRSVGTALYVAPELRSGASTSYTNKVDMYSLGIMFYEMCEVFSTGMERVRALQALRQKDYDLSQIYKADGEKAAQGRLINWLVAQKPSERPGSAELLRSDLLPVKIEDETIRQFIDGLSDQRSPYHQKLMSVLFSHDSTKRVKALTWESQNHDALDGVGQATARKFARSAIINVFERHGADFSNRQALFPKSGFYSDPAVVQLLDVYGNLLQLPYDFTLAHARQLAIRRPSIRKTFTHGNVYRDTMNGGEPRVLEEVDFDIADRDESTEAEDDAEVMKVVDEVINDLPALARQQFCFHINHGTILDAILDQCRIPLSQQPTVKETVSKLGFQAWTWVQVRKELGSSKHGLTSTSLDDLQQFNFRDTPEKARGRLQKLLTDSSSRIVALLDDGLQHLMKVERLCSAYGITHNIFIAPLASFNAKFYERHFLFQAVADRKHNRFAIAAGGRYDSLIRTLSSGKQSHSPRVQGAVGVSIALDRIVAETAKSLKAERTTYLKDQMPHEAGNEVPKRCDVLIAAQGSDALRMQGAKLACSLWAHNIRAETTYATCNEDGYAFVVAFKHEASTTVRIRSSSPKMDEVDVPLNSVISHLLQELRERDASMTKRKPPTLHRQVSHSEGEHRSNVQVLMAQHRSKKTNKYHIIEAAQQSWSQKLASEREADLLAIETRDDVMELLRYTRLSDFETWRRAIQQTQLNEQQYLQQVQQMLASSRKSWEQGEGQRKVGVFNFRTGYCMEYDVAL